MGRVRRRTRRTRRGRARRSSRRRSTTRPSIVPRSRAPSPRTASTRSTSTRSTSGPTATRRVSGRRSDRTHTRNLDRGTPATHHPGVAHGRPGSVPSRASVQGAFPMIRFGQRSAAVVAGALLLFTLIGALPAAAAAPTWSHKDAHVCGQPGQAHVRCQAIARAFYLDGQEVPTRSKSALKQTAAAAGVSYQTGKSLPTAYGLTAQGDPSKVVAIVD